MKRIFFVLAILGILSFQGFPQMQEKIIAVNGSGTINIEPNVAYVKFAVEVVENTAAKAQTANAAAMEKLIKALTDIGIEKEKIETYNFSLNPLTDYAQGKQPKVVGYRCDNQITVTIDNLDTVGKIIDTAISAGANRVDSLTFSVKDEIKYKLLALEKAIDEAKRKARTIEGAAGVQVKRIFGIIEKGADIRPLEVNRAFIAEARSIETPIIAGKIKITADVQVNFEY